MSEPSETRRCAFQTLRARPEDHAPCAIFALQMRTDKWLALRTLSFSGDDCLGFTARYLGTQSLARVARELGSHMNVLFMDHFLRISGVFNVILRCRSQQHVYPAHDADTCAPMYGSVIFDYVPEKKEFHFVFENAPVAANPAELDIFVDAKRLEKFFYVRRLDVEPSFTTKHPFVPGLCSPPPSEIGTEQPGPTDVLATRNNKQNFDNEDEENLPLPTHTERYRLVPSPQITENEEQDYEEDVMFAAPDTSEGANVDTDELLRRCMNSISDAQCLAEYEGANEEQLTEQALQTEEDVSMRHTATRLNELDQHLNDAVNRASRALDSELQLNAALRENTPPTGANENLVV